MHIFSWKACICGLFQASLLYNHSSFSWVQIFIPSIIYLLYEIFINLSLVFTEEYLSNLSALKYLLYLCTLGLLLASILLFAEAMDSELELEPATIPIFLIFILHMICKVLQEPPLFLSPLMNLITPPLAVCTMTGSCSSFYLSVMSSIFGAFGSSVVDFFNVLKPLTYVLLFITLLSVFSSKKSVFYLPFVFACISTVVIVFGQHIESLSVITTGNILLVAAVIWNNKTLKQNEQKGV